MSSCTNKRRYDDDEDELIVLNQYNVNSLAKQIIKRSIYNINAQIHLLAFTYSLIYIHLFAYLYSLIHILLFISLKFTYSLIYIHLCTVIHLFTMEYF